jgi:hypothetical protein
VARFTPGQSGNPAGRRKGARNKANLLLDQMALADARAVLRALLDRAKAGDVTAATTVLARLWPIQKGRAVTLDLPPIVAAADVTAALGVIVAAVGHGEITPEEGQSIADVVERKRRAIETVELEQRIAELEARNAPP